MSSQQSSEGSKSEEAVRIVRPSHALGSRPRRPAYRRSNIQNRNLRFKPDFFHPPLAHDAGGEGERCVVLGEGLVGRRVHLAVVGGAQERRGEAAADGFGENVLVGVRGFGAVEAGGGVAAVRANLERRHEEAGSSFSALAAFMLGIAIFRTRTYVRTRSLLLHFRPFLNRFERN
jgi:hypothetical protein